MHHAKNKMKYFQNLGKVSYNDHQVQPDWTRHEIMVMPNEDDHYSPLNHGNQQGGDTAES